MEGVYNTLQCRYQLSSGTGDSSSEDERYDNNEATIFKPTTTAAVGEEDRGRGKDDKGQRSPQGGVGVAEKEEDPYGASTDEEGGELAIFDLTTDFFPPLTRCNSEE